MIHWRRLRGQSTRTRKTGCHDIMSRDLVGFAATKTLCDIGNARDSDAAGACRDSVNVMDGDTDIGYDD